MEIKINTKTYKVKYSIRAMFIFEHLAEKPFEIKNVTDLYLFCYSMILAGMNDDLLSFEEFIEACDNNQTIIIQLSDFMNKNAQVNDQLSKNDNSKKKKQR